MRTRKAYKIIITGIFLLMFAGILPAAENDKTADTPDMSRILGVEEFVKLAAQNDTRFEEILIDELALQYRKDLNLPARDLILSIKAQYDFFLSQDREEPESTVSLEKLFPYFGTSFSASYKSTPSFSSQVNSSEFTFSISQPIAKNAFGSATRLQDKIIGLEMDVARHQIIEAYEDYFAAVINIYYDWYEAYENLKIGESSYAENLKLLENIRQRSISKIALPIDVHKIDIQVLAKKEKLVNLMEEYGRALNMVKKAIRYKGVETLMPKEPALYKWEGIDFERDYQAFKVNSRTHQILRLLENKSLLEVDKNANDLLPSINLIFGYEVNGDDFEIENEDNKIIAGVSMQLPLFEQVQTAEHKVSKITLDKTRLSAQSIDAQLYFDLKNLYRQIERERELIAISNKKIQLAQDVVVDETENYSFGKITLNDFIQAVNVLDDNRFSNITHSTRLRQLIAEWLRLTDVLVNASVLKKY